MHLQISYQFAELIQWFVFCQMVEIARQIAVPENLELRETINPILFFGNRQNSREVVLLDVGRVESGHSQESRQFADRAVTDKTHKSLEIKVRDTMLPSLS